uniref:PDZ domain-containing protein n=1 Tax=Timema cristinae TaxID=61476 RepID=A0A7R9D3M5_TIMCR|nr:unnamed protein product [Timema cristinae]
MFNFMKKGGAEKEEKEKRKKEKKERKENKKRDRGNMTTEELLRLDELDNTLVMLSSTSEDGDIEVRISVRRSLKIRGRRKEKEKLPSGITADYTASFLAGLEHNDSHCENSSNAASPSSSASLWVRGSDTLTQSDSSEASLTSLSNPATSASIQQRFLPPLPPRPPKRGILKGPRLSVSSVASGDLANHNGENHSSDSSSVLVRNTLQNEVIAYQNIPQLTSHSKLNFNSRNILVKESSVSDQGPLGISTSKNCLDRVEHRSSQQDSSKTSDDLVPSSIQTGDHSASNLTSPFLANSTIDTPNKLLTVTSTSPSAESLTDTTTTNSSFATPPFSLSPVGESQGFSGFHNRWNRYSSEGLEDLFGELPLPPLAPAFLLKHRVLTIQRQPPPRGDFGFSLRRAMVTERLGGGQQQTRAVIFAEPGSVGQHNNETGLLPGDRLLEVNGTLVDDKSREEIIDLIKSSGTHVTVKIAINLMHYSAAHSIVANTLNGLNSCENTYPLSTGKQPTSFEHSQKTDSYIAFGSFGSIRLVVSDQYSLEHFTSNEQNEPNAHEQMLKSSVTSSSIPIDLYKLLPQLCFSREDLKLTPTLAEVKGYVTCEYNNQWWLGVILPNNETTDLMEEKFLHSEDPAPSFTYPQDFEMN